MYRIREANATALPGQPAQPAADACASSPSLAQLKFFKVRGFLVKALPEPDCSDRGSSVPSVQSLPSAAHSSRFLV